MTKIVIPYVPDQCTARDLTNIASTMHDLVNRAVEIQLTIEDWDTSEAAQTVEDFFWKFVNSTAHMTTERAQELIKGKEKQDA